MDMNTLFKPVRQMEMPQCVRERIIHSCPGYRSAKTVSFKKYGIALAAILMLLVMAAAGAGQRGSFRDIKNLFGAVTGTQYLNASEEIRVSVLPEKDKLCVRISFVFPADAPYSCIEQISVGRYRITDTNGKTLVTGAGSDPAPLSGGEASVNIPVAEMPAGACFIEIGSLIGESKADQPLEIKGEWVCPIP